MINALLMVLNIIIAITVFRECLAHKRPVIGLLIAVLCFKYPLLVFLYWLLRPFIFSRIQFKTFRQKKPNSSFSKSHGSKEILCPKCGTQNTGSKCSACGNTLNL